MLLLHRWTLTVFDMLEMKKIVYTDCVRQFYIYVGMLLTLFVDIGTFRGRGVIFENTVQRIQILLLHKYKYC